MSRDILEFGFLVPFEYKTKRSKFEFYKAYLQDLISGALHPDAAKALQGRTLHRYRNQSQDQRPDFAKYQTAWGSIPGPMQRVLDERRASALQDMKQIVPGDYSIVPSAFVLQVRTAIARAGGRIA